ncbi:MAG: hypothetical protein GXO89_07515 [Chlorobi bacterium]|nr:hypothetical protein [Chlorobiota bacterium]
MKEKRKRLKQRRKEYVQEEKESIKRQKRALKEHNKAFKKRKSTSGKPFDFFGLFGSLFKSADIEGKNKARLKKHQRREFIQNEKNSLRKERREMRRKLRPMRRKIRKNKWEHFKLQTRAFLKQPFKRRNKNEAEMILREQVRYDMKRMILRKIASSPFDAARSIARFWGNRRKRVEYSMSVVRNFFLEIRYVFNIKEIKVSLLKTLVNSIVMYVLAFLATYFLSQFVTVFIASVFDIPSVVFVNRIYWPLYTYSSLYTRMALVAIFGSGPLFSLILGVGLIRLFFLMVRKTVYLKTFLLWAALHAFNNFFGAYIVGVVTRTGFVYSSEWLFLSDVLDVEEIVFLIVSLVVLAIMGYSSTKYFLQSANHSIIIEKKLRKFYLLVKVGFPWIIGSGVLYAINFGKAPTELLLFYLTPILFIIPVFTNFNSLKLQFVRPAYRVSRFGFAWGYLIALVLLIGAIILLLKEGLGFS